MIDKIAYLCSSLDENKRLVVGRRNPWHWLQRIGTSCLPCKGAKRGCQEGRRNEHTAIIRIQRHSETIIATDTFVYCKCISHRWKPVTVTTKISNHNWSIIPLISVIFMTYDIYHIWMVTIHHNNYLLWKQHM